MALDYEIKSVRLVPWVDDSHLHIELIGYSSPHVEGEEIMIDYGRGAYRPGSVDAPPWWSGRFRLRPGKAAKGVIVIIVVAGIARVSIARLRRRRALRSSAVKG